MKALVLVCNVVSLALTLLVIAGEGLSTKGFDIVVTLLIVTIPVLTIVVLARPGTPPGSGTTTVRIAGISNLILLAFVCWAVKDHPNEPGFVPYAVLMILTPLLSAVALFRYKPNQLAQA